ncbi:MAG: type II toxin-antitoxin system RelE/ParE family toxin [bacterium]|nr:type II toxin-antitoxin system RelE/ParE family toxin [bacterium]
MEGYKVTFFYNPNSGIIPVREYLDKTIRKDRAKILKYIEFLRQHGGVLDEPYTKHILGKVRELRVDFGKNRHRVFFFTFVGKNIILLHAFLKHTAKTPEAEIVKALNNYRQVVSNPKLYE